MREERKVKKMERENEKEMNYGKGIDEYLEDFQTFDFATGWNECAIIRIAMDWIN